jgi:hypothetical protein
MRALNTVRFYETDTSGYLLDVSFLGYHVFFKKSFIFIEHSGQVWYNYNRHRNGRKLAENRKFNPVPFRREPKQNWFRALKSVLLHHK